MLKLKVVMVEDFNEETSEFINEIFELELEHSLLSVAKWEAQFLRPFLQANDKTQEETLAYVEAMIVTEDYPDGVLQKLSNQNLQDINNYIDHPATATTFHDLAPVKKAKPEVITSELIYFWMLSLNIPHEYETWHLNRLFALIRVCNIKNNPKGNRKMSSAEIAARNNDLNAERKKKLGTRG